MHYFGSLNQQIVSESVMTKQYGKFFFIHEEKSHLVLIQVDKVGIKEIIRINNGLNALKEQICCSNISSLHENLAKVSHNQSD